jgi:hypothetical protein
MKQFETEVFIMKVHDDAYIEFIVKKDVVLDVGDLWESRKMSLEYLPGKKFYVLMEAEDLFNLTKETRDTGASREFGKDLHAVAMYSSNFSMKLLGNLYIRINKPAVPTRLFDKRDEAEKWLRTMMPISSS